MAVSVTELPEQIEVVPPAEIEGAADVPTVTVLALLAALVQVPEITFTV